MLTTNRTASLRDLAGATGPSISIVCPMDHLSPGNPHDDQTLAELKSAATRRLEAYVGRNGSCEQVLHNLDAAFAAVDRAHPAAGLALFAGPELTRVVPLRAAVDPRVVVGEGFAVSELVTDAVREIRARVLVLSLARTRCIDFTGSVAREHHDDNFPVVVVAPTREETPHRDFALDEHEHAEAVRFVLRAVDAALKKVHGADPRPLVLVGAERDLAYWDEVSKSTARVVGRVHGNYEWAGAQEVAALVTPVLEAHQRAYEQAAADEAREKLVHGSVCGIADVWAAAISGRGHRLIVEEGYRFAGRRDGDHLEPAVADEPEAFDAVDDAIRGQVCHDGEVVVVDDGTLADLGRIALVLRY